MNNPEIVIEKGIPIPPVSFAYRRNKNAWFRQMEVGDSILFQGDASPVFRKKMRGITNSARICLRNEGRTEVQFVSRTVEGGIRVWRTE